VSLESEALAAVLEAPDDDVPRLAYADLLSAKSDPRGEFIRVQCTLANGELEFLERRALRAQADRLLNEHGARWRRAAGLDDATPIEWRRGFIDAVTLSGEQFAGEVGETLFRTEPVRHAKLSITTAAVATAVAQSTHLSSLSSLALTGTARAESVRALLAADLSSLRGLNLSSMVDVDSLSRVFEAPSLSYLERLSLSGSDIGGAFGEGLDRWRLSSLHTLFASRCGLLDEDLRALAARPALSQLRSLCIGSNDYGVDGLRALFASPYAESLEYLEIDGCDERAMRALAESPRLMGLRRVLVLECSGILSRELRSTLRARFGDRFRYQ
jgi:uncharacterized protein (TIGR02996 family)